MSSGDLCFAGKERRVDPHGGMHACTFAAITETSLFTDMAQQSPAVTATPITNARFAAALTDLSIASLHAKAAELRNSLYHLRHSNAQLQPFADSGDRDCKEAIAENEAVMARFRERVDMLKVEVVMVRRMPWVEWDEENEHDGGSKGQVNGGHDGSNGSVLNGTAAHEEAGSGTTQDGRVQQTDGSLSDEELRRRLAQQMGEDEDDEGLHL